MKKIICLLFSLVLLVSLCACGKDNVTISVGDKIDNDTEIQSGLVDIPDDNGNIENNQNIETPEIPPELSDEEKAAQAEQEHIADIKACKEYISTIKVYLCDYSVFDFKANENIEYISSTPDAYPSEKGCSIAVIVDYGDATLKDKYRPYLDIKIVNNRPLLEGGTSVSNINTSWISDDTIGISLFRMNREVPLENLSYNIIALSKEVDYSGSFDGAVGFEDAISLLKEHNDGDSPIKIIDGRAYMLIATNFTGDDLRNIEGTNKYFLEKEYIYIPLMNGGTVDLSPEKFQFTKSEGTPDNVDFMVRINHSNHNGYGMLRYDMTVGMCAVIELSDEDKVIVEGYLNSDNYEQYKDGYNEIRKQLDKYYEGTIVSIDNGTGTFVPTHTLYSSKF